MLSPGESRAAEDVLLRVGVHASSWRGAPFVPPRLREVLAGDEERLLGARAVLAARPLAEEEAASLEGHVTRALAHLGEAAECPALAHQREVLAVDLAGLRRVREFLVRRLRNPPTVARTQGDAVKRYVRGLPVRMEKVPAEGPTISGGAAARAREGGGTLRVQGA